MPDVPSFAVDDGFLYAVPDGFDVTLGDVVRVPLGGRRVRGWVVGVEAAPSGGRRLRQVAGRRGDIPVFDAGLLSVIRWAAHHYVAPMATVLGKATPANIPRAPAEAEAGGSSPGSRERASADLVAWVGGGAWIEAIAGRISGVVERGDGSMVILPTWAEAREAAGRLTEEFGERVLVGSSHVPAARATAAWAEAALVSGRIVVGTREVAWWRVRGLGVAVVVGEGRRGLKDKATPTVHARDVLVQRSKVERFACIVCDVVPTAETVHRASRVDVVERPWGLVEVVDRRDDAPGGPLLGERSRAALRASMSDARTVLVFTHRRVAAQRCVRCRLLRRCTGCGSTPGPGSECRRCGEPIGACASCGGGRFEALGAGVARLVAETGGVVGADAVGEVGSGRPVVVGTERDLPGLAVDQTIVVDADGLLMAPTYRAAEDGLRVLARAVAAAGRGRGRRAVVQTMQPDHPAIQALLRADPVAFVRDDAARRAGLGLPPGGELLVVEAAGLPDGSPDELEEAVGERASVYGPAVSGDRLRWLVQARDLRAARTVLRAVVARWRDGGVRVRIDADPMDL